jgi:ribosomal protein L21E
VKYKVGDKVRVAAPPTPTSRTGEYQGFRGVVYSVNSHITAPYPYGVKLYVKGKAKFLNMAEDEIEPIEIPISDGKDSAVDHPSHYTWLPNGLEVIDLAEHLNFSRGNAVKYIARAGHKDAATELEDLKKARWYIDREIQRIEKEQGK